MLKLLLVITAIAVTLSGCSSPASRQAMTPQQVAVSKHYPYSLSVHTSGGSETSGLDSSNIADADLKAAVEEAVAKSALFKHVVQGSGGDYELNVQVVSLARPMIGTTLNVELEMGWSLVRSADKAVVMRKSIQSTGNASMGDAFAFATRLRLAVEIAARNNIEQGIKAIAELNL